jgi:hypothetical protein
MKKPSKKTVLTLSSTAVAAAALFGIVYAYFSTQTDPQSATGTVGTVSLSDVQIKFDPSETHSEDLADNVIDAETGELKNLNPGDIIPVKFDVENMGTKSVFSKTYIYLVFDNNGEGYSRYSNFIDCVTVKDADGNVVPPESIVRGTYLIGETWYPALRFEAQDYSGNESFDVLNGTGDNAEIEQGIEVNKVTHTFKIDFSLDANVHTQNESMSVKTFTRALQYRNTADDDIDDLMDDSSFFKADDTVDEGGRA